MKTINPFYTKNIDNSVSVGEIFPNASCLYCDDSGEVPATRQEAREYQMDKIIARPDLPGNEKICLSLKMWKRFEETKINGVGRVPCRCQD